MTQIACNEQNVFRDILFELNTNFGKRKNDHHGGQPQWRKITSRAQNNYASADKQT